MIAALSNLSIQYNLQAIAIALAFMDNSASTNDPAYVPPYPRSEMEASLLKSLVFAGAIFGMCTMGYAGDVLGRRDAMALTNFLAFIGALGSAAFTWGDAQTVYRILMACRFVIGVGVGGKYPLSATMRSEACSSGCESEGRPRHHSSTRVALGFFWQTPGAMLPYAVALACMQAFGRHGHYHRATASAEFRIVFGLGAVPALLVMLLCPSQEDSTDYRLARAAAAGGGCKRRQLATALRHPEHWRRLVGTGATWLLFDLVYYGTTLNQPAILDSVFGRAEGLWANALQNILAAAFGVPGVLLAIANLRCMRTKRLQHWGFVANAASAALLVAVALCAPSDRALNFGAFCLLITCLNWGPNVSTFVLPTEVFPTAIRSSFFGLSAAMGKAGALLGGAVFGPIIASSGERGLPIVLLLCSAVSIGGVGLTIFFVEPYGHRLCG